MARANPQYQALCNDPQTLAIFAGASGYVSPSWYTERDSAPTWNYAAVHCHGVLTFSPDDEHTLWTVQVLLEKMEKGRPNAWSISELGEADIKRRLPFIVGFEISIERIEAKFQMSQYERPGDTFAAIKALEKEGKQDLAQAMRNFGCCHQAPQKQNL